MRPLVNSLRYCRYSYSGYAKPFLPLHYEEVRNVKDSTLSTVSRNFSTGKFSQVSVNN